MSSATGTFDEEVLGRLLDPSRDRHMLEPGSAFGFSLGVRRGRFEAVRRGDISLERTRFARGRGVEVFDLRFLVAQPPRPRPEQLRERQVYLEKIAAQPARKASSR